MKPNKEMAEHYLLEIATLLGKFYAACGITEEESLKNGKEVIEFMNKYEINLNPKEQDE